MSDALELAIKIFATDSNAKTTIQGIGKEVRAAEDHLIGFGKASDNATQKLETGSKRARDEFGKFIKTTDDLKTSIDNVGRSNGFEQAEAKAKGFYTALDQAHDKTENLQRAATNIRNVGLGMAAAGTGGILLSNHLIEVSEEGRNVEARLESILEAQKRLQDLGSINSTIGDIATRSHAPDDDPIREAAVQMASDQVSSSDMPDLLEAAARNAEALKLPIDQVGTLFAKAYAEGNLSRLKRSNILFTEQEEAAVKAAYGISEAAGKAKFMEVVMASTARSTGELGSGLTDTQKAANDAARAADDAMTAIGEGSAHAQAGIDGLKGSLASVAAVNPALAEGSGYLLTYGSYALAGAGGLLALAGQAGQVYLAFVALQTARAANAVAAEADAVASTSEAAAITSVGVAAEGTAVGLNMMTLGVTAIGVAAALTVGYVAYAFGQHMGWIDEEQSYVERLTAGWYRLSDAILSTQNVHGAALEQNEKELAQGIEKLKADNQKKVDDGVMTQAQADEANRKGEIDLRQKFANEQRRVGDDKNYLKNSEAVARLKQQEDLARSTANAGASTPGGAPFSPALTAAATGGDSSDAQIDALEDQLAATTDKAQQKAIKDQLRLARRAAKDQKALDKSAEKLHKANEKLLDKKADAESDILLAQIEADTDVQVAQLEALKTDDNEKETKTKIAKLRADAIRKKAQIQSASLLAGEHDEADVLAANKILDLANIQASKEEKLASIDKPDKEKKGKGKKNAFVLSDALAFLRSGGTIFDFEADKRDSGKSGKSSAAQSTPNTPRDLEVRAQTRVTQNPIGKRVLKIIVPDVSLDDAMGDALAGLG